MPTTGWRRAIDGWLESRNGELRSLRRHLHTHPEPSREEYQTTRFLAEKLSLAGIPHVIAPSGRGIIAGPENPRGFPVIAVRGDIDALRIHDAKEVPYR